jgi:hypothetical protein
MMAEVGFVLFLCLLFVWIILVIYEAWKYEHEMKQ